MWDKGRPRVVRQDNDQNSSRDYANDMEVVVVEGKFCGFEDKAKPVEINGFEEEVYQNPHIIQ